MAQAGPAGHDQPMMKLLIVDDSELIRARLRGRLEAIPGVAAIHTAETLVQTLKRVRAELPTLLILDIHLPEGNAIQLIGLMKEMAPGMQIAILTNDASEFSRRKCLAVGADWFFDKSTEFENLLELVQQLATLNATPQATKKQTP